MRGYSLAAMAVLAVGAALTAVRPAAAAPVDVGVCVARPGYAMLGIVRQKRLTDHDLDSTIFGTPPGGHSALAAGQTDVYGGTTDYTPLVVARGSDVATVAFVNPSDGVDHVILGGGVGLSDLPGQKVSAPQACIGHLLIGVWRDSVGITPGRVAWVNLNAGAAVGPMMPGDLAAANRYEPWISKVLAASPGARSVVNTPGPEGVGTGIFMEGMFMNRICVAEPRGVAVGVLRARWPGPGPGHCNAHTDAANALIAEFLKWSGGDVGSVTGSNGKFLSQVPRGGYLHAGL